MVGVNNRFVFSISINSAGTIIAVGSNNYNSGDGCASVWQYISNTWTQIGSIFANTIGTSAQSGSSISINSAGTIVAVGSVNYNNNGCASVWQNNSGTWTQIGSVFADSIGISAQSGFSISINSTGTIVAVGSKNYNSGYGCVSVWQNNSGSWTQIGNVFADTIGSNAYSGSSISINSAGTIVAIGSIGYNSSNGCASVWQNNSGTWTQIGNIFANTFGSNV